MKKTIVVASLLIIVLSTGTGFIISRGTQNMGVRMSAKDLSDYGLTIIRPSDPDFDALAAEHLKDVPVEAVDNIKPLTFFIRNASRRTVVAHAIIWDCVDANGKPQRIKELHANSEALTDAEEYFAALPRTNLDKTIRPGGARLFSLLALPRSAGRDGPGVSVDSDDGTSLSGGGGASSAESLAHAASKLLSKCAELTVSVDGVFFDDGAFVGPDEAGLFDQVRAQVEAKLELRREIGARVARGERADEIFKDLELKASAEGTRNPLSITAIEDRRRHFRQFFANLLVLQGKAYGRDKALEMALGPKGKGRPEPRLRKLETPADLR